MMNSTIVVKINKSTVESRDAEKLLKEVCEFLSNKPNTDYMQLKDRFIDFLKNRNLLKTPERLKILEKISFENNAFTINSIHTEVIKDLLINIKTVSRTFNLLIEANIIKKVNIDSDCLNTTYFELV